jgi:quercetin dioxygenase-like cupin family protein
MLTARTVTGPTGRSHFEELPLPYMEGQSQGVPPVPAVGIQFRHSEGETVRDWHPAPRRQMVVVLSGRLEIQTGDGATKTFYPGDVLLADDLTGQGHISRNRGESLRAWIHTPNWDPPKTKDGLPETPRVEPGTKMRKGTAIRLSTGPDGKSHFKDLGEFWLPAQGQRDAPFLPATAVYFPRSVGDRVADWHHAPRRQFGIVLTGELEVEVGNGEKRVFTAGDMLLAEDLTGQGHITRSRGDRRMMFVALADGVQAPGA